MSKSRNEIFIEFEYNGREIDGIEEFKIDLNKDYLIQGRSIYIPSFSEGGETWITIFINSSFFELAKDVVLYGTAWDLLKKGAKRYFLGPFYSAIDKLEKANKESYVLRIQQLRFQFDDIEIVFGGIEYQRIAVVSKVFNEISKRREKIEQKNKMPISKIETPIFYNPSIDKRGYSPYLLDNSRRQSVDSYLDLWKIWFMNGSDCQIYKLQDETFMDAYPNDK